jgi:predicted nuclease of restriction endonuclease-like (RecB) superfamily
MSPDVDDFDSLVGAIVDVHTRLHRQAAKAVNTALTLRNWLIGCYVHEYELGGRDRPDYGEQLFERLSTRLSEHGVPRVGSRDLRRYSLFYVTYPQLRSALGHDLERALPTSQGSRKIWESVTAGSVLPAQELLRGLSFTHITELLAIDDPTQRAFYELQAIKGQWSVRELRRQIGTLLYERTGLSRDKVAAVEQAQSGAEANTPAAIIRDPYVFEFLGIPARDLMGESHLEDALVDKVQEFLLELGRGFCFEARQKRIPIGDELFFVDLVFYHRILKCHVLIELKVDRFRHEHLGQLNTYVTWFRRHEMGEGDNPPIGLLLCTGKNHALVEYALAGMDNNLFVSKYLLALPAKEEMQRFVDEQMEAELGERKGAPGDGGLRGD